MELRFIANTDEDYTLGKFRILDILDEEMFFVVVEEELADIYFWSLVGLNFIVSTLKARGQVLVDGELFNMGTFPLANILHTHKVFESKLDKEVIKSIKEDLDKFEIELIKVIIDKERSN